MSHPDPIRQRLDRLTKPPGSLGRLEDVAHRLATIYGDPPRALRDRAIFVLAGDHGVAGMGVSAYPSEVTAQMCLNYAAGGAAINAIARAVGARVVVADFGVVSDSVPEGVLDRKVRRGAGNIAIEPAMTRSEACTAIERGRQLFHDAGAPDVVALGEMGIGNTTAAAALTAAFTGAPVDAVVGRGTGIDDAAIGRKRDAVRQALSRVNGWPDPVDALAELGGLEIAGLVGLTLESVAQGRAVVTDGFIATSAVLVAEALQPGTVAGVVASHCSREPGHAVQLARLRLVPLLDLDLRLGEGTGAALALPIIDAAGAVLREMATFESAGVSTAS